MNVSRVIIAFVTSAVLSSFSDWYFFGVLFHDRYRKTPGIWKVYRDRRDELLSIGIAQAIMCISSLAFICLCVRLNLVATTSAVTAALAAWLMSAAPILATNAIFIPMDRLIVASHALGWLARFMIAALCVSWIM